MNRLPVAWFACLATVIVACSTIKPETTVPPQPSGDSLRTPAALQSRGSFSAEAERARGSSRRSSRGVAVHVESADEYPAYIEARDGVGRALYVGKVSRDHPLCFRWPFVAAGGEMWARGRTEYRVRFEPWTSEGWGWSVGADLKPRDAYCR